ncbi:MAG: class I SAM-dependent methyltransferase [Clostridia bacterium]|nr:class I SAM-dependent methyltransferase [Clostridia bacterium]
MLIADKWTDYNLIDASDGLKLEKWGDYYLSRPDPQAIWSYKREKNLWNNAHAEYHRSKSGGGSWEYRKKLPEAWQVKYSELIFNVKPMGFKHTGLFPEQAVNWDFIIDKISSAQREIKVLNLFAYTGGATVASAYAGAKTVHVDASKGMVNWAKENAASSGLSNAPIRYIVDDCVKFVEREIRRGNKYDGIIMDPPTYGRGPKGELWRFEDELFNLVKKCNELMSDNPLFFIVNSYTSGISHIVVSNVLSYIIKNSHGGTVTSDELGLKMSSNGLVLPCGYTTRWFK